MKKSVLVVLVLLYSLSGVYAEESIVTDKSEKVGIILKNIGDMTLKYSEEKKQTTYSKLILQIQEHRDNREELDDDLKETLSELQRILENKLLTKKEVLDRTEDFYKNSLQEKTYSCEISASSDIISTIKDKDITEDELIEKVDKSLFWKTAQYSNGIYIWGNPDAGYVWYIDVDWKGNIASQRNLTGYWVYEKPIAKLYNEYNIKTEIINNTNYSKTFWPEQHLNRLLQEFSKWNYVQLWGDICTTPEFDDWELELGDIVQSDVDNWKNAKNSCWSLWQDRKRVWYYEEEWELIKHQWLIWEHNFYLLGYEWSIEKPTSIIVWDTSTGKHIYPLKEWMRKWEEMDYRSIIVFND